MVGIATTEETNGEVVEKSAAKYKIKAIGKVNIPRMHINHVHENYSIRLSQSDHIQQILMEFKMENSNTVLMPMGPNMIQHESNDGLAQDGISNATYISKLLDAAHAT
jgi:hypothetical protein